MIPSSRPLVAMLVALALSTPLHAEEPRHHDAHLHGEARLNLALEGRALLVELESPAANLIGFEHPPRDAGERAALQQAVERLRRGGELLGLPAEAGCRQAEVEIESSLLEASERHHEEEHHEEEHEHEEEGGHADFMVGYHFECDRPEVLTGLTLRLFERFPGVERLHVQAITPSGQRGAELSAERPDLTLQ